jgi:hypothetical protein
VGDTKRKRARVAHKPVRRKVSSAPPAAPPPASACADEDAFAEALIASGEAAPLDKAGKLPAGATHKLSKRKDGAVKVVRRRFSIA